MEKTITQFYCDICKKEAVVVKISYPVIFHTDQTEGRHCKPYISQQKLDVCDDCCKKILMLDAYGAQGYNDYSITGGIKNEPTGPL